MGILALASSILNLDDRLHQWLISAVALDLLLITTLSSPNIIGWDIHEEYFLFSQTLMNGFWNPATNVFYNSALSVTILPAIISELTGLDGDLIFKLVYPAIYSLAPVVLYTLYKNIVPPRTAFVSVLFLLFYPPSYEELSALGRQEVGELILVLLILMLLNSRTHFSLQDRFVIVLLTLGLVISHYSLTYLYMLFLLSTWILSRITGRVLGLTRLPTIALTFAIALLWYFYVAGGAAGVALSTFVIGLASTFLADFLNPASRPMVTMQAFGLETVTAGALHEIYRLIQYTVLGSLSVGFLAFAWKRGKNAIETEFLGMMTVASLLLAVSVLVPFFAAGLNFTRIVQVALVFLSPCFGIGAGKIESTIRKGALLLRHQTGINSYRPRLAATILFCYLLFTSGWIWAVSLDAPTSLALDWQRMSRSSDLFVRVEYFQEFTVPQDRDGAQWFGHYVPREFSACADFVSRTHALASYGGLGTPAKGNYPSPPNCDFSRGEYLYLSVLNEIYGVGTDGNSIWNITLSMYTKNNRIYSNGGAAIYSP